MEQNQFAIYGTRVVLDVDVTGSNGSWFLHAMVGTCQGCTGMGHYHRYTQYICARVHDYNFIFIIGKNVRVALYTLYYFYFKLLLSLQRSTPSSKFHFEHSSTTILSHSLSTIQLHLINLTIHLVVFSF